VAEWGIFPLFPFHLICKVSVSKPVFFFFFFFANFLTGHVIEMAVKESTIFLVWVFPCNVSLQVYGAAVYALKRDSCLVYIQSVRELSLCGMSRMVCLT
jgi:hypothetical protein